MKRKKPKPSERPFVTTHKLPFESAPYFRTEDWLMFRIGTCQGLWRSTQVSYDILSITNDEPGNGHLEDVFQWFSHACRRDGKSFRIMEVGNKDFLRHLIKKKGL